jgi:hypothetical protein
MQSWSRTEFWTIPRRSGSISVEEGWAWMGCFFGRTIDPGAEIKKRP